MVVRMRSTRSHTGNRRAHHKLSKPALAKDQDGNISLRHRMNPTTGKYKGRIVVDFAAKKASKLARRKAASEANK